jgi:hypothetical protein
VRGNQQKTGQSAEPLLAKSPNLSHTGGMQFLAVIIS